MAELREVVDLLAAAHPGRPVRRRARALSARDLATTVLRALVERTGLDARPVDSRDRRARATRRWSRPAFGRVAALDAGFPVTTTGYQLDRRCGSGLQAVLNAAMEVQTGVGRRRSSRSASSR